MSTPTQEIDMLLTKMTEIGASDLHLRIGMPPLVRLHGGMTPVPEEPVLDKKRIERIVGSMLTDEYKQDFYENKSVDFAHSVPNIARFRVNFFLQQKQMGAVMRRIPEKIPNLYELSAPKALLQFAREARGLVLVTGPTGSGKSTTLAAVIDVINSERSEHILTIEEPIEFVHPSKKSLVNQREVGPDTPSFKRALRDGLRQDPDIILVGEMRDYETISIALTAAETGHLVFGTLHTSSADSTISRVIDVFPADQQEQARTMLASSLKGVVCQTLIPRLDGSGRVAAHEVMVSTNAIRANIRENKLGRIRDAMQTGHQNMMQTLDKSLAYLVSCNVIAEDIALEKSINKQEFTELLNSMRNGNNVATPQLVKQEDLYNEMSANSMTMSQEQPNNQPIITEKQTEYQQNKPPMPMDMGQQQPTSMPMQAQAQPMDIGNQQQPTQAQPMGMGYQQQSPMPMQAQSQTMDMGQYQQPMQSQPMQAQPQTQSMKSQAQPMNMDQPQPQPMQSQEQGSKQKRIGRLFADDDELMQ